jgi:peptide deformylase
MRNLVLDDDPILRNRGQIFDFNNPQEDPTKLIEELLNAMVKYEGMGLSACQIGIDLKVFVMRFNNDAIACFNPRITYYSNETTYMREGCLTYPGLFFPVIRSQGINATYSNKEGDEMSGSFIDISAKVFQHEYDHMIGKVYLEYASDYMIRNARKKQILWNRKRKNNGGKQINIR